MKSKDYKRAQESLDDVSSDVEPIVEEKKHSFLAQNIDPS
jgi:hypothetical protein